MEDFAHLVMDGFIKTIKEMNYTCGIIHCSKKAEYCQNTTIGQVLLCGDCFKEAWGLLK